MKFNPPPNWPTPPEGFTPGARLGPGPVAAGAAPGWQLWVEDDVVLPGRDHRGDAPLQALQAGHHVVLRRRRLLPRRRDLDDRHGELDDRHLLVRRHDRRRHRAGACVHRVPGRAQGRRPVARPGSPSGDRRRRCSSRCSAPASARRRASSRPRSLADRRGLVLDRRRRRDGRAPSAATPTHQFKAVSEVASPEQCPDELYLEATPRPAAPLPAGGLRPRAGRST